MIDNFRQNGELFDAFKVQISNLLSEENTRQLYDALQNGNLEVGEDDPLLIIDYLDELNNVFLLLILILLFLFSHYFRLTYQMDLLLINN